jgi:hypothetical protein
MNDVLFKSYLKKRGKQPHVIENLVKAVKLFEMELTGKHKCAIDNADTDEIKQYIDTAECSRKGAGRKIARAIALYYASTGESQKAKFASGIRSRAIETTRKVFQLKDYKGIDKDHVQKLRELGIINVEQMLEQGKTSAARKKLAVTTGIPLDIITRYVKLSDLSRLGAVKSVRAILYFEAGYDSPIKLAAADPAKLREYLIAFVKKTKFDGIAPLPKELESTIAAAKKLKPVVK